MSGLTEREIASQPELWRRAAALVDSVGDVLPRPGREGLLHRVRNLALHLPGRRRAARGAGLTARADAFPASEVPLERDYDLAVAVSRSGTTTEVLEVVRGLQPEVPVLALTADAESPLGCWRRGSSSCRSPTRSRWCRRGLPPARWRCCAPRWGSTWMRWRPTGCGRSSGEVPVDVAAVRQLVFLGSGWSVGLASEAGLKVREAAQAWSEAYPAMEYRHGPISVAQPGTVVWALSSLPAGLAGGDRGDRCDVGRGLARSRWPSWCGSSGWRWPWRGTRA